MASIPGHGDTGAGVGRVGAVAIATGEPAIAKHAYRALGSYRFLLACMVLFNHSANLLHPELWRLGFGNVGVLLFFAVSGFVICEACDAFYRGRTAPFLLNRALKIFPAYWGATLVAYLIYLQVDPARVPDAPTPHLEWWPLLVNASLLLGYLRPGNGLTLLSQTWAVLVECQFYLLAALVFFIADRVRARSAWLGGVALLSIAGYFYVGLTDAQHRFFGGLQYAPFFIWGSALYFSLTRRSVGAELLAAAAFVLSIHAFFEYGVAWQATPSFLREMLATGSWAQLIETMAYVAAAALLVSLPQVVASPRLERIDKRLGDLTYALYLIHMPVIALGRHLGATGATGFIAVCGASLLGAWVLHRWCERPVYAIRDLLRGRKLYD